MKEKMKKIVKGMAVTAIALSVIFGSVSSPTPVKAEAKGTAFINKKVSSVTPTIKSAKRSKGKVTVTVSVPTSKVKKLGKAKKITVAYGSTKNSKKFEAKKLQAKVTKKGKNQYTFTVNNKNLASYKNAYITVRFDGKSNWSKLVKVSGKATTPKKSEWWVVECNTCHKAWQGPNQDKLLKVFSNHCDESAKAWHAKYDSQCHSIQDTLRLMEEHPYCKDGYTNYYNAYAPSLNPETVY